MDYSAWMLNLRYWILFCCGLIGLNAQQARLISSCKTPLGSGRCTSSEDACRDLGGITVNPVFFATLPKTDPACDRGEECCVLLPLPTEDSCSTCGITGVEDDDQKRIENEKFPKRVLPNFEAIQWTPWRPRSFEDEPDSFDMLDARISKMATVNKWCWQVALMDKNGSIFGSGALVDGNNVVTLAHNVAGRRPEDITLVLGATDFMRPVSSLADAVWLASPKKILVHDQFNPMTLANDLAVIRIPLAPCNQLNICPVCINDLPAGADMAVDQPDPCLLTSWGPPNAVGLSSSLRQMSVKLVDNEQCFHTLTDLGVVGFKIPETQFCAKSSKDIQTAPTGSCESDSGAPLICLGGDRKWYLRGLVTITTDACTLDSNKPFLATDVGMLFSWIKIQASNQDPRFGRIPGIPNRQLIRTDNGRKYPRRSRLRHSQNTNSFQAPVPRFFSDDMPPIPFDNPWLQII